MYQIGLLLLTGPFRVVIESISQYLKCANKNVIKLLYVKLEPEFNNPFKKSDVASLRRLSDFVPLIYNKASSLCQNLDVRVVLSDTRKRKTNIDRSSTFDVVLTNWEEEVKNISNYVDYHFKEKCDNIIKLHENVNKQSEVFDCNVQHRSIEFQIYNTVCLGGTFDRLHNGHKVLLSEAALRATEKLIVGITDVSMLKRKVLWELIEPVEKRIFDVTTFLLDVDPSLHYEVVPITDPYGPTITNPDIDCLVVSAETRLGGDKVNYERKNRGMSELSMYIVDLVENAHKIPGEEEKLSSSTGRMHLLGTCLKAPHVASNNIYTVFLQGQPMSGKSCISDCFKNKGATVINCCDIIKSILNNGKETKTFLDKFSDCLSKEDESIDYMKLICRCLKDKGRRQWIADNLHEKVEGKIKLKIQTHEKEGAGLIIIQDSLLFDGNFKCSEVNELWCTVIPVTEITKRLVTSYNLSEEDATNAVLSLPSNEKYIKKSNRVFSSQWSSEITEQQITRAWSDVRLRIQ